MLLATSKPGGENQCTQTGRRSYRPLITHKRRYSSSRTTELFVQCVMSRLHFVLLPWFPLSSTSFSFSSQQRQQNEPSSAFDYPSFQLFHPLNRIFKLELSHHLSPQPPAENVSTGSDHINNTRWDASEAAISKMMVTIEKEESHDNQ